MTLISKKPRDPMLHIRLDPEILELLKLEANRLYMSQTSYVQLAIESALGLEPNEKVSKSLLGRVKAIEGVLEQLKPYDLNHTTLP